MLSGGIRLLFAAAGAIAGIILRRVRRTRRQAPGDPQEVVILTGAPPEIATEPAWQAPSKTPEPCEILSESQRGQQQATSVDEMPVLNKLEAVPPVADVPAQIASAELPLPQARNETTDADTLPGDAPISAVEDQSGVSSSIEEDITPSASPTHAEAPIPAIEDPLLDKREAFSPAALVPAQIASAEIFQSAAPADAGTLPGDAPTSAAEDQSVVSSLIEEGAAPSASPPHAEVPIPAIEDPLPPEQPDRCAGNNKPRDAPSDATTSAACFTSTNAPTVHPSSSETIEPVTPPIRVSARIAVHRDRRGARRAVPRETTSPVSTAAARPLRQAEAKLRLAVDPIRRYVALSLVLDRPEGFPDTVEIDFNGPQTAGAYDAFRYDDIDLDWTSELLVGELRISDARQRLEWLRSSRDIHLFAPGELDLLSVSAARVGVEYAVVCRRQDAAGVVAAADSAGSSPLAVVDTWKGLAPGWVILCGYTPARPIASIADQRLSGLDPGSGTEILLKGGLRIRANHFAEGHAPRIIIQPLAPNSCVFIGGRPASQDDTGAWIGPAWEEPGTHLIDIVGGPSLTCSIDSDPGAERAWPIPDDALAPFGMAPAAQAALIGAFVQPLSGQRFFAAEPNQSVVALGHRAGAQALAPRIDVPAAISTLPFEAVFLVISSGPRRRQGRVLWLGTRPSGSAQPRSRPDISWVSAVLGASARRLDVYPSEDDAKRAWRSAVTAARRMRRQKT